MLCTTRPLPRCIDVGIVAFIPVGRMESPRTESSNDAAKKLLGCRAISLSDSQGKVQKSATKKLTNDRIYVSMLYLH
jgi:hypothetical protein